MFRKFLIGITGALMSFGVATPAFAHDPSEDHEQFHEERAQEHELEHEQLELQHENAHRFLDQEHARVHAEGRGDDPYLHWLMHRRLNRQHRTEHLREWIQHGREHQNAAAEHQEYHRLFYPYGYDGSYRYDQGNGRYRVYDYRYGY